MWRLQVRFGKSICNKRHCLPILHASKFCSTRPQQYNVAFIFFPSCAPHWSITTPAGITYNWFLMILGFFVPTAIIVITNVVLVTNLHSVSCKIIYEKYYWSKLNCNMKRIIRFSFWNTSKIIRYFKRRLKQIKELQLSPLSAGKVFTDKELRNG